MGGFLFNSVPPGGLTLAPRVPLAARVPLTSLPSPPWPNLVAFGEAVARCRRARGLTIEQLANLSGVSRQTIGNVEKGHKAPRLDTVYALAWALDVSVASLVDALEPAAAPGWADVPGRDLDDGGASCCPL